MVIEAVELSLHDLIEADYRLGVETAFERI